MDTYSLVIAGVAAGLICWQVWENRRAVRVGEKQTAIARESLRLAGRSQVRIDKWRGSWIDEKTIEVRFRVINASSVPAKIEYFTCEVGEQQVCDASDCPFTLTQGEEYPIRFALGASEWYWYEKDNDVAVTIQGEVVYSDQFFMGRSKKFSRICTRAVQRTMGKNQLTFDYPEKVGLNYEEEYDNGNDSPN